MRSAWLGNTVWRPSGGVVKIFKLVIRGGSEETVRTVLRRLLVPFVCVAVVLALAPFALRTMGAWLVVQDALQPARSIVVLGGKVPFRAMEAAAIYRQGWAPEVWLTEGGVFEEDLTLAKLGIEHPPEYAYSRRVLEHFDVPHDVIRVLSGPNQNTADEVRTIARAVDLNRGSAPDPGSVARGDPSAPLRSLAAKGGNRVILITSKYHTRRVRVLSRALVGSSAEAIVRYAHDDPFDPRRWWHNTADAQMVLHEWFGLLNAWAGFPLKSGR
jgi:uncharacterized SAM-binding protein YcdF (DUF218 family)